MQAAEPEPAELLGEEEEEEDVFGGGLPARLPEVMLVGPPSLSPGGPNGIIRSQSFAGFSGLQERRSRCNSFIENASALKKPQAKLKRMHNLGHKSSGAPKEPQPARVEEVYRALKGGLDEYLEAHQTELDKLAAQLKDMRRNSRLGVLYDLDKQIKTIERYIRRLEFHISKVDELYEAYCIQRRLQDGASKMKQAFASSPHSKAARESLAEVHRSHREYTENMCAIEAELESLLGEFCVRMKGLAGFARLCPGDQYEIFMKYGRQRWKLKGKIEVNGRQSWDGEETVFLPLIAGLISIKVTEVKGLATHLLVGSVTCETKELFAARPQVLAVDINDLGTIKLSLEIAWHPFDVEDATPPAGPGGKAAALQRRMSVYSQGAPETPPFREHAFFSNLPDDTFESDEAGAEAKRPLSLSSEDLPNGGPARPEITVTPAALHRGPRAEGAEEDDAQDGGSVSSRGSSAGGPGPTPTPEEDAEGPPRSEARPAPPGPAAAAAEAEAGRLFLERAVAEALLRESDEASELKPVELDASEGNVTKQLVQRLTSAEAPAAAAAGERLPCEGPAGGRGFLDGSLEDALQGLSLALEPHREQHHEFRRLSQAVTHLDDVLRCKPPGSRSTPSGLSLTVESALESFDFLNTSDFDEEEEEDGDEGGPVGGADTVFSDTETETEKNGYRPAHPEARAHLSEALTEDTGVGTSVAGSPLPLTTGSESLDIAIARHLQQCTRLVQQIVFSSKTPFVARSLLEKLSRQIRVMETLAVLSDEHLGSTGSELDAVPELHQQPALLSFWAACCGPAGVFHSSADRLVQQLQTSFAGAINADYPGLADPVFRTLVAQMLDRPEPLLSPSLASEVVTVFQFHGYFSGPGAGGLEGHVRQLAGQVSVARSLQSLRDEKLRQAVSGLPAQQEVLRALALLLAGADRGASQAVRLCLEAAAGNQHFREKALLYYCEALTAHDPQLQKAACLALQSLQATESIRMLVGLCQSDAEEIRNVAAETLLSLGEDGRLAYEQLDKFPRDCVHVGGRHGTEVATAF